MKYEGGGEEPPFVAPFISDEMGGNLKRQGGFSPLSQSYNGLKPIASKEARGEMKIAAGNRCA